MQKAADKKLIAIDIDDVLSAHAEAFIAYSNHRWGTNLTVDDYDEDWALIWKIDQAELERRSSEIHASKLITTYRPNISADPILRKLAQRYRLAIITSRRKWVAEETHSWLERHYKGIFSEVHFAGIWDDLENHSKNKVKLTKANIAKQIGADYLIDDQPKHCLAAAEAGITAILFGDYSWNRETKVIPNMIRAKNWQEVGEYFDGNPR